MSLSAIAALDSQRGIGFNNQLAWNIPEDLKRFQKITQGHTIIMGRKTLESIGKPLKERVHIVLSENPSWQAPDFAQRMSLEQVLEHFLHTPQEAFVIGGQQIYTLLLPFCQKLYLTHLFQSFLVDTYFPEFEKDFTCVSTQMQENYCFKDYERRDKVKP
jgi:dihydrofolate reductase